MKTNNFALYNGKIVYVPEVPLHVWSDHPDPNKSGFYQKALQSAIASGIEVENQDDVMFEIEKMVINKLAKETKGSPVVISSYGVFRDKIKESTLYPLQCRVEDMWRFRTYKTEEAYRSGRFYCEEVFTDHSAMKVFSSKHSAEAKKTFPNYVSNYEKIARVTFEQPEKKDYNARYNRISQSETFKRDYDGKSIGIEPEAAGQEQDLPEWVADKIKDKKQILELQEQTASLQKQIELLQIRDEKREARESNLYKENGGLHAQIESLQKQVEELREEVEMWKKHYALATGGIQELREENERYRLAQETLKELCTGQLGNFVSTLDVLIALNPQDNQK